MSHPQPTNAKVSSFRLPPFISSTISSSALTKNWSDPFEQEETTFDQPPSPSPPPSSKARSIDSTSSSKTVKPSPYFWSSADGTNPVKTNPFSPLKDWKPKDEVPSREKAIKRLVSNPSHPSNPITSRTGQNAIDVVVTASAGHQARAYGPNSRTAAGYFQVRQEKLKEQAAGKKDEIFKGVRVYLDGWLGVGVTNLEVKAAVNSHGGTVSEYANSHVTHIITHEPLSASKNNAFLKKIKGWKPQVVDPQWVYECVAKGRKVDVLKFLILNPCDQPRVSAFFGSAKPQQQQDPEAKRPKLVGSKSRSSSSLSSTATVFSSSSLGPQSRSAPSIAKASSVTSSFSKSTAVKRSSRKEAIEID